MRCQYYRTCVKKPKWKVISPSGERLRWPFEKMSVEPPSKISHSWNSSRDIMSGICKICGSEKWPNEGTKQTTSLGRIKSRQSSGLPQNFFYMDLWDSQLGEVSSVTGQIKRSRQADKRGERQRENQLCHVQPLIESIICSVLSNPVAVEVKKKGWLHMCGSSVVTDCSCLIIKIK